MGTDLFVFHGYTELYLDGKWVKATPAFNLSLCTKFRVKPLEFDGRADSIKAFARDNKATPVSLVFTESELNQVVNKSATSAQGVTLSDAKITIDAGGIHGTAKAATQFITVNASADVVGGPVGDKFTLKVSRLAADPLPPGLIDAMKGLVDSSTADISGTVPFLVKQVAFRNGCFWVSGVTPS